MCGKMHSDHHVHKTLKVRVDFFPHCLFLSWLDNRPYVFLWVIFPVTSSPHRRPSQWHCALHSHLFLWACPWFPLFVLEPQDFSWWYDVFSCYITTMACGFAFLFFLYPIYVGPICPELYRKCLHTTLKSDTVSIMLVKADSFQCMTKPTTIL